MTQRKVRGRWRERRAGTVTAGQALIPVIEALGGMEAFRFVTLWRAWPEVVGEHLAGLARPLGHRKGSLILAAEDPVVAQELSYFNQEIVDRANAFLGDKVFDKVVFELLDGRVPLDGHEAGPEKRPAPPPKKPEGLGGLTPILKEDTAIGRCYRAYLALFDRGA